MVGQRFLTRVRGRSHHAHAVGGREAQQPPWNQALPRNRGRRISRGLLSSAGADVSMTW